MNGLLSRYVSEFRGGRDLSAEDADIFLDTLIAETDEARLENLFTAWNTKGIAEDEIYSLARIMRDRCTRVRSNFDSFVDIVGTGGSRTKTFNVSTAAAFIVAGAGIPVAKHGNKAATSNSGSADVLSALGVKPDVDAAVAERNLNELGICFMFAPNFHRLSPTLGKVRRRLGFPTIFNCVGPLCNPANAPHQLIGVWDESLLPKMAGAIARLGTRKSWIVHGNGGIDEISLTGLTKVAEVEGGTVRTFEISPDEFSVSPVLSDAVEKLSPNESASVIRRVLSNELKGSAAEGVVMINAMAAIYFCGRSKKISDAVDVALESIRSGSALRKLIQLAEAAAV